MEPNFGTSEPEVEFSRALDPDVDEASIKELLIPAGRYITIPPVVVREIKQEAKGRLSFVGTASATTEDGSRTEKIDFWFSHQRVNREDGSPDASYKLYLQLRQVYKTLHETAPTTIDQIVEMLGLYPVVLRVTQYNERNYVVDVKPAAKG